MMGWLFDLFKPKAYKLRKRLDKLRERLDLYRPRTEEERDEKSEIYNLMDEANDKISQLEEGLVKDFERKYVEKEISDLLRRIEEDMRKLR